MVGSSSGYTAYLENGSKFENQGTFSLSDNTHLVDGGGATNQVVNASTGTIGFTGSTTTASASIDVALTNNGVLTAAKGALGVNLTNLSSGELLGGTYQATAGTLTIPGPITKNSATIALGATGVIANAQTGTTALSTLATNAGTLTLARSTSIGNALANSSTISVTAGTLNPTAFSQSAGTTTVGTGAVLKAGSGTAAIAVAGGTVTGNGTLQGATSGSGTVKPGSAAGPLAITGSYAPSTTGTLAIPVSGPTTVGTDYGQLAATGAATLKGTLAIQTASGYLPPLGTQYTILKAASISGAFATVTGSTLSDRQYVLSTTATTVVLTVKQAPGFTSTSTGTATVGAAGSIAITTKGSPAPAITAMGALPNGVTFVDNGDGTATLAGTPTAGSGGTYTLALSASNGVGTTATSAYTLTVNEAPAITSAASSTFTTGTAGTFPVSATGFPKPALTVTGALPSGVTFTDNGDGTGKFSGTPAATAGGTYPVTISADNGTAVTQSFVLTVGQAPTFTSAAAATFTVGQAGSFTVKTTGFPKPAVTKTGTLPSGVTFVDNGDGTATLAGTPAAGTGGDVPLTITADNGVGTAATQSFVLSVKDGPRFTSAATASFVVGQAGTFTITTSGTPAAAITSSSTLPPGVTLVDNHDGTATLAGTPTTASAASYSIALTATSTAGTATQTLVLTVKLAPTISTTTSTSFGRGVANSFVIKTTGRPAPALTATGALPAGVTFTDNANGTATLAGTPTTNGTSTLTIKATNGVGTGVTQTFTLTVSDPAAPVFTTPPSRSWAVGTAGTFTIRTTGAPAATFTRTGSLPSGLSFSGATNYATITGTPAAGTAGSYPQTITATNSSGTTTQTFTVKVGAAAGPAFTSATSAAFPTGQASTFSVGTSGFPSATIAKASGTLPTGVTLTNLGDGTASLAGTPVTAGSYTLTFSATNGVGAAVTQTFTLAVTNAPSFTSDVTATFATGVARTFTVTTSGTPKPSITASGALPSGVTFSDNGDGSAKFTGTAPAAAVGTYPITLTATNGPGSSSTQALSLVVRKSKAPAISSAASQVFATGAADSFDVTTSGYPQATITKTGTLPAGLTFVDNNDGTATLSGTPAAGTDGTYPITITADNGTATPATQSFVLKTGPATAPTFTGTAFAGFAIGTASSFTVTTTGTPTATITKSGTLPAGLTFHDNNDGTATISGTPAPDTDGTYAISLTARNSSSAKRTYMIDVN